MKKFIFAFLLIPILALSQKKQIDTITSKTKIYTALSTTNSFYKKDDYEVKGKGKINFTAIILHDITLNTTIKGAKVYAQNVGFMVTESIGTYFDETEITDIIKCLKYIVENVDIEVSPDHAQWFYFKNVDDFEIGAKAAKNSKFKIYLRQNYRIMRDEEITMSRKDLDEVYNSL